jgi:hypothetical protein
VEDPAQNAFVGDRKFLLEAAEKYVVHQRLLFACLAELNAVAHGALTGAFQLMPPHGVGRQISGPQAAELHLSSVSC